MSLSINHAILHVFDFVACENIFAGEELDLAENKNAKRYITSQVKKALGNLDNKRGAFSEDSGFARELRAYFAGETDFASLSRQIGEYLAGELGHMEKTPSTDLLVVDFEENPEMTVNEMSEEDMEAQFSGKTNRYLALFLLEIKQAYMHEVGMGKTGACNDIARHYAVLPNPSQKVASFAVVDLRSLDVLFQDKPRTISGEERMLIPDGLLQCSTEASTKEAFTAVTDLVESVAEEYGANTAVALSKAKTYATERVDEGEDVDMELLAEDVFEDFPDAQVKFTKEVEERAMPESMPMEREAVRRVARKHKILTDTGIEITFPAEYSKSSEYLTFTSEADGSISIELRNILHIENR